ncbi:MAG TPA: alpha/beta hydrolase [Candidatus Dormibacteraeota bacterium]
MSPPALHSGFVTVGRLQVHHTYGGRGSPVLFIHGLGSSGYIEWRFNLAPLARSHRVLAPDLPGFGRTDKPRTARYGIPLFARTLLRYLDAIGQRSVAVVGTSMGGRVALELALEFRTRVSKLVLVNSLGLGRPQVQLVYPLVMLPRVGEAAMRVAREAVNRAPAGVIRHFASRYTGAAADLERTMDDSYLELLREMYSAEGYADAYLATVRSMVRPSAVFGRHDLTPRLRQIKVPVLLVWGSADPLFPLAHATRAHRELPGSQLAVIEGAGHTPQAERPDEFNRVLSRFL